MNGGFMSDLSSNSMSREELIRSARANCMRSIDHPQGGASSEINRVQSEQSPFQKSTYVRLFLSCLILLGVLAVKKLDLSYQGIDYETIQHCVEDNQHFEKLEQYATKTLEEDVLPVFSRGAKTE